MKGEVAYVGVPDLPIQVERRRAELRGRPLVVLRQGNEDGRQAVEAVSDEARALGVRPGQTPRQAEHFCPEAVVVTADAPAYTAAYAVLLAALGHCSPIIQTDRGPAELPGDPGDRWGAELDVAGLELLFGPPPVLASELVRQAARAGLRARVGLGQSRLVARLAAGLAAPGGSLIVAPSETRAFLEPLPIACLPLGEESRERLELLGVRSLGHLLRLPRAGLARQVGADALALARAAEAEGELLAPYRPAEWLAAEVDLEVPPETRQQLRLALAPLVVGLAARLRQRYLGAGAVRLRLGSAGAGEGARASRERLARLAAPTASVDVLLEAAEGLAGELARWDDGAAPTVRPPDWLELAVGGLGQLGGRQTGLFDGQRQRRTQAARAVEELAGRFHGRLQAPGFLGHAVGR